MQQNLNWEYLLTDQLNKYSQSLRKRFDTIFISCKSRTLFINISLLNTLVSITKHANLGHKRKIRTSVCHYFLFVR